MLADEEDRHRRDRSRRRRILSARAAAPRMPGRGRPAHGSRVHGRRRRRTAAPARTRLRHRRARVAAAVGLWRPSGAPSTLASGLAAPWSVVPLARRRSADQPARRRGDPRAHVSTASCGWQESFPASSRAASPGCTASPCGRGRPTRWLYAYHGAADDNRVVRMPLLGEAGALGLGESEVVLDGIARATPTTAAASRSARTGILYVDDGRCAAPGAAQDADALGGKILRLTPDGEPAPGQPVRHRRLDSRASQRARSRVDERRPAVGERVRAEHLGRAQPHRRGRELRLADRRGRGRR